MNGKPVNLADIITDFQALAAQTGPSFRVRDAEAVGAWSYYKGRAIGLKFNDVKKLAGLPCKTRAPNGHGGKNNKYEPCKIKDGPGKTKRCLGILPSDNQCRTLVELPARLCGRCRQRNNS